MKTPWSDLVKYGVATATLLVVAFAGLIALSVIGIVVALTKFVAFIK